jgi:Na+/proline symporter
MKELDPDYEKKILLDVVKQMKNPEDTERSQSLIRRTIFAISYIGLLAAFIMALNKMGHPFISALLAAASGCATGFAIFMQFAQKQWPVTRKYINMERVQKRLDEFEV